MGTNCTCRQYLNSEILPSLSFDNSKDLISKANPPYSKDNIDNNDKSYNDDEDTASLKTIHQETFNPKMSTPSIQFTINSNSLRKIQHIQASCRLYLNKQRNEPYKTTTNFNSISTTEISKYDHRLIDIVNHLRDKYTVVFPKNTAKHNKEGLCHLYWNDGSILKGNYENNKLNGYGSIILNATKKKYVGQFIDNKLNGYGIYRQYTQLNIEGQWLNGKLHGVAIEEFSDGTTFKGIYQDGYRNGLGTYTFPDDCVFQGEFRNHKMNGIGLLKYRNGNTYEGSFKDNLFNDYGEYTWATKEKYLGFWSKGEKDGFGIYINYNEYVAYVGYWKKNKQDSYGIWYAINKRKQPTFGIWRNGIKEKGYKTYAAFIKDFNNKSHKSIEEKRMVKQYFYMSNDKIKYFFINLEEKNFGES